MSGENFAGSAPMWRIQGKGISADDFMRQKNQNNVHFAYGTMWRFQKDSDNKKARAKMLADKKAALEKKKSQIPAPLDNELVDEAKAKGMAVSLPDTASTAEQEEAVSDLKARVEANGAADEGMDEEAQDLADAVKTSFTESQLKGLPHNQLRDLASSLGVANLGAPKANLIKAILEKQA